MKLYLRFTFIVTIIFNLCSQQVGAQTPNASFTQNTTAGCAPLTINFSNNSSNAANYFWDFGNGNTSVLTNPSNVYSLPGVYTVKLYATSASGQTDSLIATNLITVAQSPVAGFYPATTASCLDGNSFAFVNTSINGVTWLWDFGDGNTSTAQNPVHHYTAAGIYTVQLIATNANGCSNLFVFPQCVQVYPKPSVTFTANVTTACDTSQVFQFNSFGSATSYLWNFGDGNTSTLINPSHNYNSPGTYDVSLVVTNSQGCADTIEQNNYITILNPQMPSFSANDSLGCAPFQVMFTDLSINGQAWYWDFGDGNYSTLQHPSHTYQNAGSYHVSLTVTYPNGCSYIRTINNFITANSAPVAYFTATNTSGCWPVVPQFTNLSTNATSYLWDFGNNFTSPLANPNFSYNGSGNFTVKLHAYNSGGCHSMYQMPGTVNVTRPSAHFTATPVNGCAPHAVTFTAANTNLSSYLWDFGDGNTSTLQNPSHTYTLPGYYSPRLIVTDVQGCTDTVVRPGYINVINTAVNLPPPTPVNGCVPYTASFSDATPGAVSWLWDFGDGNTSTQQNPSHTYTTPGFYTVSLLIQVSSGCSQYYSQFRIYNIESISAGATLTQTQCAPFTVTFTDTTSNAVSWAWDFGDGFTSNLQNPVHNYPGSGVYTVNLTTTTQGGCSSTIVMSNAVNYTSCSNAAGGPPSNNNLNGSWQFPPVTGCVPLSIAFHDVLAGATAWEWDFGDNVTSTLQHPYHTYTSPGVYTVRMIGHYPSGNADTVLYNNYVIANGTTAGFTMVTSNTCQSSQASFTSTSVNASAWNWNFGDGNTSTLENPVHTYSGNNSNYSIMLTASGPGGCSSVASTSIFSAGAGLPIWANAYNVCVNAPVSFTCITSYSSYLWNFGDGNTSTLQNPSHSYATGGSYTVTLTVTDANGCPQTITLPTAITVQQPIANFSSVLTGTCNALAIQFTNLSTGVTLPLSSHLYWNYGDNTPPSWSANPTHTYTSPGTYTVTLNAYTMSTCFSSISKTVQVYPTQANFSFTQNTACFPITATFVDSSYNAVSWLWNFGDGHTSTLQNPTHTYTTAPTGPVTLTITDVRGCSSTITRPNIKIFNTNFSVSAMSGCGPLTISLSDSSINAASWMWDFGDGHTSTLQNPTHIYNSNGSYNITLVSQTADGCVDSMTIGPVNAYKPTANFISPSSAACAPSMVSFTDQSSGAATWLWDFGDGTYSNAQNPSHIYGLPGNYTITLVVGSSIGCYDTIVKTDYVHVLGPVAAFTPSSTQVCAQSTVQFNDLTTGASVWNWNFGDGNTSTQQAPSHTYQNAGQYTVSLIVYDTLGCSANFSISSPIQVSALPVSSFSASDTFACAPAPLSFTGLSTGVSQWSWDFGDGNYSSLASPSHTYSNAGVYSVQLAVATSAGCTDTSQFSITVNPKPVAAFATDVTYGCSPLQVHFNDASSSTSALTWLWDLGNNSSSASPDPQATYANPGFYDVSLVVTNAFGCSDTAIQSSYIHVFDTVAPAASSILTATVTSDTSTFIVWTPTNAVDFAAYIVYRQDPQTGSFLQVGTVTNSSTTSFADNSLNTLDQSYCYKVQTVDYCGYGLPLDSLTAHCTINVTAAGQGADINVSWTPYLGATVASYQVYRMEPGNPAPVLIATVQSSVLSVIDSSIICPSPYSYRVKATNLNHLAISSSSDTAVARPAVSPLAGQRVDVVRSTVINNSSVLTEWKAPSVEPGSVTGYNIYRSENNEQFTLVAELPAAAFAYIDNDVNVSEQNYFYRVEVVNSCGMQVQGGNAGSSILLSASPGEYSTILSWTPYEGWDMGVDYYVIEKQNGNGEWEIIKIVDGNMHEYEEK